MASALRSAIPRHVGVPISRPPAIRLMSTHGDDHLDKKEVVDRVIDVVKELPKS